MNLCPDCGTELGDFGPCVCAFDPKRKKPGRMAMSMREMVERKLKRKNDELDR